ncbi:MAG: 5'-nucleotidase SurE1 [Candidatus Bathyarchaeota archaeon BA1]|nr:MAG: 5'-nucleotidase SurE1 [Candidatus Bathyarchaeota archaeon BA1]
MPTILLINDDGIRSVGLIALKKRLERLGDLVVVAPREERSGIGKALTTSKCIKIVKTRLSDGSKAYAITGTPADAFLLAVNKILKRPPDLLVAGINLGPNLGIDDLLNSGTLGAALEAAIHRVPAIAVSYCMREITEQKEGKAMVTLEELEFTANLAQKAVEYVLKNGMPPDVDIISINVPENADAKRVRVTSLSYVGYHDIYTGQRGGYAIRGWKLSSYPDDEQGTDIHAVKREGCISITPIKIQLHHSTKALRSLSKVLAA